MYREHSSHLTAPFPCFIGSARLAMATAEWLEAAGLGGLTERVGHLTLQQLRGLLISDFERFGVTDMGDKQKLFRALQITKTNSPSPQLTPQPSGPVRWGARTIGRH